MKTVYKVMMLMTPSSGRTRLENALREVGYAATLADEGLFALTELERGQIDVVVCGNALEDMSGSEFFEMLKDDAQLEGTGFVLLSGVGAQMLGRGGDMQIPESTGAEDVVNFVSGLIAKRTRAQARVAGSTAPLLPGDEVGPGNKVERPTEPPRLTSRAGSNPRASEFGGTLEHFSLFDLLMLLTQTGKTGQLSIRLGSEEARMVLEEGRLYHAEFLEQSGEAVVTRIFIEAERAANTAFSFDAFKTRRLPPEYHKLRSIQSPTDQLLLNVAIALDQHKEGQRG